MRSRGEGPTGPRTTRQPSADRSPLHLRHADAGLPPAPAARRARADLSARGQVAGRLVDLGSYPGAVPRPARAHPRRGLPVARSRAVGGAGLGGGTPVSSPGGRRPERRTARERAAFIYWYRGPLDRGVPIPGGDYRAHAPATSIYHHPRPVGGVRCRVEAAQLIKDDQDHLIHPLHHPSDHLEPMVYVRGRGAMLTDIQGREYIDGLAGLWNVNVGHGRAELAEAAADQMRELAYFSAYTGSTNIPAIQLASKLIDARVPEHAGRLLHLGRRRVQRVGVQDRALLLEDQGQARQGQGHRAHARLSRRDAAGDERHRHVALLEDVRAARAGLRAHPDLLSLPPGGRQARRDRGPDRGAAARGGHPARGRRTRWPPSSPSRSTAAAACSTRPTTTSRSCARSATSTRCSSSPTRSSPASAAPASGSRSSTGTCCPTSSPSPRACPRAISRSAASWSRRRSSRRWTR